jgi:hypothetical protein
VAVTVQEDDTLMVPASPDWPHPLVASHPYESAPLEPETVEVQLYE